MDWDDFLDHDVVKHVWQTARERRVGPWAVLGVSLVRAAATVPPTKTLPALVGARMSTNLFVALVGRSGEGKGGAEGAAADAVRFSKWSVDTVPLGSGEGIARTFRPAGTEPDAVNPVERVIISAAEIDTLTALTGRQGSTLSAELRKLYSGETIGFANASHATRSIVKAHSYRACMIAGVQPERAGPLLSAADGGLPQRFVWLPVDDPDAPDMPSAAPEPRNVEVPNWSTEREDIVVPTLAKTAIDEHRLAVLRGDSDVDPLDGHAFLTRLKVAAAFMALEGRTVVAEDHWHMAGVVMAVSARTRYDCRTALAEKARSTTRARAHATADHDEIVSERKHTRCKQGVLRWLATLPNGDHLALNALRSKLKADVRDHLGAALAELVDHGEIQEVPLPRGTGYRKVQGVPEVHRLPPAEKEGVPPVQGVPQCISCGAQLGATGKCIQCIARKASSSVGVAS
jgi:hypothetical protein